MSGEQKLFHGIKLTDEQINAVEAQKLARIDWYKRDADQHMLDAIATTNQKEG